MRASRLSRFLAVAVVLTGCIGCGDPSGGISNSTTGVGASASGSSSKAFRILQEQKNKAENVTRCAVELIKSERMPEVRQLYKSRWSDLADLRTNIAFDNELTSGDKANIDRALRAEQESITEILAKYERLYGPGQQGRLTGVCSRWRPLRSPAAAAET